MYIIIDIIVVAIIIIGGLVGYKKGLSDILINIVGVILALILAFTFKGAVAEFIESTTGIGSSIKASISDGIAEAASEKLNIDIKSEEKKSEDEINEENISSEEDSTESTETEEKKERKNTQKDNPFYKALIDNMNLDEGIDNISQKVVDFIMQTASFILIFLVVYLCVFILKMMLNLVFKLPILATINKTGGLVANLILTLIKMWVLFAIISFLSPIIPALPDIINSTFITKMLYDTNLIVMLLSGDLKF